MCPRDVCVRVRKGDSPVDKANTTGPDERTNRPTTLCSLGFSHRVPATSSETPTNTRLLVVGSVEIYAPEEFLWEFREEDVAGPGVDRSRKNRWTERGRTPMPEQSGQVGQRAIQFSARVCLIFLSFFIPPTPGPRLFYRRTNATNSRHCR